jgi:hypothetical protein
VTRIEFGCGLIAFAGFTVISFLVLSHLMLIPASVSIQATDHGGPGRGGRFDVVGFPSGGVGFISLETPGPDAEDRALKMRMRSFADGTVKQTIEGWDPYVSGSNSILSRSPFLVPLIVNGARWFKIFDPDWDLKRKHAPAFCETGATPEVIAKHSPSGLLCIVQEINGVPDGTAVGRHEETHCGPVTVYEKGSKKRISDIASEGEIAKRFLFSGDETRLVLEWVSEIPSLRTPKNEIGGPFVRGRRITMHDVRSGKCLLRIEDGCAESISFDGAYLKLFNYDVSGCKIDRVLEVESGIVKLESRQAALRGMFIPHTTLLLTLDDECRECGIIEDWLRRVAARWVAGAKDRWTRLKMTDMKNGRCWIPNVGFSKETSAVPSPDGEWLILCRDEEVEMTVSSRLEIYRLPLKFRITPLIIESMVLGCLGAWCVIASGRKWKGTKTQ